MDRMKTLGKYALWVILFWILSDILIYFGLNTTYKDIEARSEIPAGIEVVQMQATTVNGRVTLKVDDETLSGKYIKIDLYSSTGVNVGTKYLEIGNLTAEEVKEIETYFKIAEVKSYEISIVDEMGQNTEGFMDTALSALSAIVLVIKFLIL